MIVDLLGMLASNEQITTFLNNLNLKLEEATSVNGYHNPDTIYVNFEESGLSLSSLAKVSERD